ncbi:CoA transferase [Staphylococcus gallinarum]|uniref:CoA transferase n=1 Tax=Staphylococcus gallinarum TaxID=1293 RepID=UPI00344B14E4
MMINNANELKAHLLQQNKNRLQSDQFDMHAALEDILNSVGYSTADSGGKVTFYGKDPVMPSTLRLASLAGLGLAAKSVALAHLWQVRGGKGQDIHIDIRKAVKRLSPFYERKWETLNGFPAKSQEDPHTLFRFDFYQTKDKRWVMPLNPYPNAKAHVLELLNCRSTKEAVAEAIKGWNGQDLEIAGAEKGVVMPMVRSLEEFVEEEQFQHIAETELIEIKKIADSKPEAFSEEPEQPLSGVRALGMGHVIAGAGLGRGLALHGADVLNVWRPSELEVETMYLTSNVGMRSTYLDIDHNQEHRSRFDALLQGADIFFINKRYGFMEKYGLTPNDLAQKRPGIIHASVNLHGHTGPWKNRNGFDQTAGSVTGVMTLEGSVDKPKLPPIVVVNDYVISWLLELGVIKALERRAKEGGSYSVSVSLSKVSAYLMSLGIFDKDYAKTMSNSNEEHQIVAPDQFEAETPLGTYKGVTDQVYMSETPGEYDTVLMVRGSDKPRWKA